jgi:hypothetical protein
MRRRVLALSSIGCLSLCAAVVIVASRPGGVSYAFAPSPGGQKWLAFASFRGTFWLEEDFVPSYTGAWIRAKPGLHDYHDVFPFWLSPGDAAGP